MDLYSCIEMNLEQQMSNDPVDWTKIRFPAPLQFKEVEALLSYLSRTLPADVSYEVEDTVSGTKIKQLD